MKGIKAWITGHTIDYLGDKIDDSVIEDMIDTIDEAFPAKQTIQVLEEIKQLIGRIYFAINRRIHAIQKAELLKKDARETKRAKLKDARLKRSRDHKGVT